MRTLPAQTRAWVTASATGALLLAVASVARPAPAWAEEPVTYEVVSDYVQSADIEYQDASGRQWAFRAPLPWRIDTTVHAVGEAPPTGSQVRADWRGREAPGRWVSVRIIYRGQLLCQNTLDVGNATCYGITQRLT